MTTFEDIRNAYERFMTAQDAYWQDLEAKANAIELGLAKHLGVDDIRWYDGTSNRRYVELGIIGQGDSFKRIPRGEELPSERLAVKFALRVTFESEERPDDRGHVTLECSMRRGPDAYLIEVEVGRDDMEAEVQRSFGQDEQAALYEQLSQMVLRQLDTLSYL